MQAEPEWTSHIQGKAGLFAAVNEVLQTANASDWNSWIDHAFDFLVRVLRPDASAGIEGH